MAGYQYRGALTLAEEMRAEAFRRRRQVGLELLEAERASVAHATYLHQVREAAEASGYTVSRVVLFGGPEGLAEAAAEAAAVSWRKPRLQQKVRRCGTPMGWYQHRERGEDPCGRCTQAVEKLWKAVRKPDTPVREKCGTLEGMAEHYRRHERRCPKCRLAVAQGVVEVYHPRRVGQTVQRYVPRPG